MNIETQQRMISVIRNSFDTNLTTVAELIGCERKDVSDVVYKGKGCGLSAKKLTFLFTQAKRFSKMNYIRPDFMFTRPVLCHPSCKQTLLNGEQLNKEALAQLKVFDILEAESRAKGQGGKKPVRTLQEVVDDLSTPYFGESYNYGN